MWTVERTSVYSIEDYNPIRTLVSGLVLLVS